MVNYELRVFNGFNALVIDCGECKRACSLKSNECADCVNSLGLNFSLLELRKNNSHVYFDDSLSIKIKSGIFDSAPKIVPKFLLFYAVFPFDGKVIEENDFFKIVERENEKFIVFTPLECDLESKDLEKFSGAVLKIQEEDNDGYDSFGLEDDVLELVDSYTKGLGVFDKILQIPEIQDVFINSPGNSCVFFNHSRHGSLKSNLFVKKEMINRLSTFLRTCSGRPFDESFPVIHTNIPDFNTRICGITFPLTHDGVGFALRKHHLNPLSVSRLVADGFMDSSIAALVWFLIDSDIKILITGPRGSGKTTLLSALLFLSSKLNRMIIIEDTAELPVNYLKGLGFNVEHLRTNSFEGVNSFEFSNDAALRTALRLGESLLVLGEVRGTEARFLFEAMRVGASGNNVLGTIHGSSAFDTFDRVVNDLGVPPSSFKAADLVISCSYFNSKKVRGRKLFEMTEVKKDWSLNPLKEKGFLNIASLNPKTGKYSFNLKNSDLLKSIAFKKGVGIAQCMKEINGREKIIELIIENYNSFKNEKLLSNELIVGLCEEDCEKTYAVSKLISSFMLKNDFNDDIIDALKAAKAFDKESALSSKELFDMVGGSSRIKFTASLNLLESCKMIEGFSSSNKRHWFLRR
ncbi:MAG: ATPase, T2SS/T4P/T4SS family [Candidatus Nanoarchaeia archaeon]|nr:ATPase, T2SS/T4P/T4SS family [Candidatus Nanoarchaeia archaeon]MDD5054279.1 ATPase, T2SS/T4P/T4SS family [Candidatus Nanoarchaeia archaeon]